MSAGGSRSPAPKVSRRDSLRFNARQTIPQFLRGMFTRRRRWSWVLDRVMSDPQGVRLVRDLRQRYGSDYLWLNVLGKPSLLVLHPDGIRRILDASPDVYGPPDIKVRGMSHFQPDALTVSTGDDWKRRRAFSDAVLAPSASVHPGAREFLAAVDAAFGSLLHVPYPAITWADFHGAFRALTARVVFGPGLDSEQVLLRLDALMKRANRVAGQSDTPGRRALHEAIRTRVADPRAAGLAAAACPHMHLGDPLPVAGQMTHWLFAMKDTLAVNCANAIALIAAHPQVQAKARAEAAATDLSDPAAVNGMAYLEGCLRDTMRLWPTTPLIVRKALQDDVLDGHPVLAGAQVVIHNGFNHRDPDASPDPDTFNPERWQQGVWDYRSNPMSNGPQSCGGRDLALFLGKAVLGRFLRGHQWMMARPALDPGAPVPYAFRTQALLLRGRVG